MKKPDGLHGCLVALMLFVSMETPALHAVPHTHKIVIVISLDGFPAYALDDPRLPIPTLRKLARDGVAAKSMRPVNPTVTWPNHTAMVTGVDASEHGVLFNGLLTPPTAEKPSSIEPFAPKDVLVRVPTVYDLAHEAGLVTAQVDWVATYQAKNISWKFPEIPDPNGAIERELIADGTVTPEQLRTFEDGNEAWQDQIWTSAAADILQKHTPNLLLFHLLALDDTNHQYGPMSLASFTAIGFLDNQVKRIVNAVNRNGLSPQTTFIIVSDHGFRTMKHKLHPNVLLREKGLLSDPTNNQRGVARVVAEGGSAMVYLTRTGDKSKSLAALRDVFSGAEGVDHVYGEEDFARLGLPLRAVNEQAPDLLLTGAPDYGFGNESEGDYVTQIAEGGTHGYLNDDPQMQAIFIACGAGIPKGLQLDQISNLDVAPTIAALLGLEMRHVKGHTIPEIVKSDTRRP